MSKPEPKHQRDRTSALKLRWHEPTDPIDRVECIAALVTANARLGDPPGRAAGPGQVGH